MTHKEVMQQALENATRNCDNNAEQQALDALLREALAQPAPMSQPNRTIAYSAANKLQALGYQWTGNEWALAQPEQEPVAWNWMQEGNPFGPAYYGNPPDADIQEVSSRNGKTVRLLYAAPPQRQPLTDGKLVEIELSLRQYTDGDRYDLSLHDYARAIEAAHGIKEQS